MKKYVIQDTKTGHLFMYSAADTAERAWDQLDYYDARCYPCQVPRSQLWAVLVEIKVIRTEG